MSPTTLPSEWPCFPDAVTIAEHCPVHYFSLRTSQAIITYTYTVGTLHLMTSISFPFKKIKMKNGLYSQMCLLCLLQASQSH